MAYHFESGEAITDGVGEAVAELTDEGLSRRRSLVERRDRLVEDEGDLQSDIDGLVERLGESRQRWLGGIRPQMASKHSGRGWHAPAAEAARHWSGPAKTRRRRPSTSFASAPSTTGTTRTCFVCCAGPYF